MPSMLNGVLLTVGLGLLPLTTLYISTLYLSPFDAKSIRR